MQCIKIILRGEVHKQYKPSPRNKKNLKQLKLPPKIIRRTKNKKPHKDSRRKKIQRGNERDKSDRKKTIKTKSWLFQNINKPNKLLTRLTKKKREDPNKKWKDNNWYHEIQKKHKKLLWIVIHQQIGWPRRNEQVYRNIQPAKLSKREIDNLNIIITRSENRICNNKAPWKQSRTSGFTGECFFLIISFILLFFNINLF